MNAVRNGSVAGALADWTRGFRTCLRFADCARLFGLALVLPLVFACGLVLDFDPDFDLGFVLNLALEPLFFFIARVP